MLNNKQNRIVQRLASGDRIVGSLTRDSKWSYAWQGTCELIRTSDLGVLYRDGLISLVRMDGEHHGYELTNSQSVSGPTPTADKTAVASRGSAERSLDPG
jgi:hypothetical protein